MIARRSFKKEVLLYALPNVSAQESDQRQSAAREYQLEIESLPLLAAVKTLSDETGLDVLFFSDVANGVYSQPVKGRYTSTQALKAMLTGTDLEPVDLGKDGALGIRAKDGEQEPGKSQPASNKDLIAAQAGTPVQQSQTTATSP